MAAEYIKIEKLKALFFSYEDSISVISEISEILNDEVFGVLLDPVVYLIDGYESVKVVITLEVASRVRLNNLSSERIADVVQDELKFNASLEKDLAELGYGAELINWYEVKLRVV